MVFKQKKFSFQRYTKTVWTWRAPQIKAKPFFCSFYLFQNSFLGLSVHIWRLFLCCILCSSSRLFSGMLRFRFVCGSFWCRPTRDDCILFWVFICYSLLKCVGNDFVCVLVILSISVSSVWSLPLRWESEGKESQGKVSAGHREWEQIVWRTWQGSAAISQSLPLDLSAVLDSFFLKSQISPWLFLSVY